jgi:benzoyl-CoA reductase/2-hydroxyglutaryl-CoA dehydratase subunit BcrC/BadD/HgdB
MQSQKFTGLVGYTCDYFPVELIDAFGCKPVRLTGFSGVENNISHLTHQNLCGYAKAIISEAVSGVYADIVAIITVNSCDAMRRTGELLRMANPSIKTFIVDLVRKDNELALSLFCGRLKKFIGEFEAEMGVKLDTEDLAKSVSTRNRGRELIEKWQSLNMKYDGPLGARESYELLLSRGISSPIEFNDKMAAMIADFESHIKKGATSEAGEKPRVLITGGSFNLGPIINVLDKTEMSVAVYDQCMVGRTMAPITEDGDILTNIAAGYLKRLPCARMNFADRRLDYIRGLVDNKVIDCIVYVLYGGCDIFMYDHALLEQRLKGLNVPTIVIESTMPTMKSSQWVTRLEAFAEMVHARVRSYR